MLDGQTLRWDYHFGSEQLLANAAHRLLRDSEDQAASLLLHAEAVETTVAFVPVGSEPASGARRLRLAVPMDLEDHFTPMLLDVFTTAFQPDFAEQVASTEVAGKADTSAGWRDRLENALVGRPSNQATLYPLGRSHPTEDRLAFRSTAEVAVYRSLKRLQQLAHTKRPGDSLTILPLPAARFPETTLEPDFLVIYRGRVLALEVDGPSHDTRRRKDIGREHVLLGAGITCLRRIDVRDTNNDEALDEQLGIFLRHLVGATAA